MFSTDLHTDFAIKAKRLASKYGIYLEIDWQNSVLDFQGKYTDEEMQVLIGELTNLAQLYDCEELFY